MGEIYGEIDKDCLYVGPMLLTQEQGRVSTHSVISEREKQWLDEPFPYDELREYKRQGKKVIYAAFGTVATGKMFWENDVAPSKMFGAVASGKVYCRTLWERIFKAFGGKENYVVVMATVAEDPKALEGFEIPANFIVRRKCPQLDVLQYFADQYDNAKTVSREHMGLHFDDPLTSCTAKMMASDVDTLLMLRERFSLNCARVQRSLERAGGASKASRAIEQYVDNFQGHQLVKCSTKSFDVDYIDFLLQRCNTGSFRGKDFGSGSDFAPMLPSEMLPSFEA